MINFYILILKKCINKKIIIKKNIKNIKIFIFTLLLSTPSVNFLLLVRFIKTWNKKTISTKYWYKNNGIIIPNVPTIKKIIKGSNLQIQLPVLPQLKESQLHQEIGKNKYNTIFNKIKENKCFSNKEIFINPKNYI